MRGRWTASPAGHRAAAGQERSLTPVTFVGSYPTADFSLTPPHPEIALVGRSNVGKSSLLNALVGRKAIARTSGSPGKTRTCNVYRVDERYYLVDLPGYGFARASRTDRAAFRRLLEAYLAERPAVAGVVWLLDARHRPSRDDLAVGAALAEHALPVLVALTKVDKLTRSRRGEQLETIAAMIGVPEEQCVLTSVPDREGVTELRAAVEALAAA